MKFAVESINWILVIQVVVAVLIQLQDFLAKGEFSPLAIAMFVTAALQIIIKMVDGGSIKSFKLL